MKAKFRKQNKKHTHTTIQTKREEGKAQTASDGSSFEERCHIRNQQQRKENTKKAIQKRYTQCAGHE